MLSCSVPAGWPANRTGLRRSGPGSDAALGRGPLLGVMVVVMVVVVMMVLLSSERRAGKHHQKQDRCKNLFHGMNVTQIRPRMVAGRWLRIYKGNGCDAVPRRYAKQRKLKLR